MQTLSEAIASFRRQIEDALQHEGITRDQGQGSPAWHAERLTLSLTVVLGEDGVARVVGQEGDREPAGGRHVVTIEFRLGAKAAASPATDLPVPPTLPAERTAVVGSERPIGLLTKLLGPLGFDSSARAAVFCDALRALGPGKESELPASLMMSEKAIQDETLRRARHLIRGVVQSGPLKSLERASALLTDLFTGLQLPDLIELVEEKWRPGDTWSD